MAETSRFWDGTTIGDATVAPYDAATETAGVLISLSGAGGIATNLSGVFRGELNALAVSGASSPVSVATGRAITYGTWYENNTGAVTVAIPTPSVSTRIDRIVLRKDWTLQTIRITRIAGVEGGAAPPLVQSAGSQWDEPLAQASITTGGVITLTDQRQFIGSGPLVNIGTFAVGDILYADTTATLARLAVGAAGTVLVGGTTPGYSSTISTGINSGIVITIGGGGAGVNGTAHLILNTASTGAGSAQVLYQRNGGTSIWQEGIDSGTTGMKTANTDFFWYNGSTYVAALSTGGVLRTNGSIFINQTTNTKSTIGITIQQGANSDEMVSLKSSSVAHGMTSITETDTYGFLKRAGGSGQLTVSGLGSSGGGMFLNSYHTTDDTTKTTNSYGVLLSDNFLKSGTSTTSVGATANLIVFRNAGTTEFIFRGDGTPYQHAGTTWTNFDEYDDIALLTAASGAVSRPDDPIGHSFREYVKKYRNVLETTGLVVINDGPDEDGSVFWSLSGFIQLSIGAIRQVGDKVKAIEDRLTNIESQLALAGA